MSDPFDRLWSNFLEGELDPEGLAELEQLLANNPELVSRAADLYATHRGLGFLHQSFDRNAMRDDLLSRIRADRERFVALVRERLPAPAAHPYRRWRYGLVAAAAVLLTVMVQSVLRLPPERTPASQEYVATLVRADRPVWNTSGLPPIGGRLEPGRYSLRSGAVAIQFDGGLLAIVTAPSDIQIDSRTSLTLMRGRLLMRAAEEAAGFVVRTPVRDVIDLGTEFAVEVSSNTVDVHVIEGVVEANRPGGSREVLEAGAAVRYLSDQPDRSVPIPLTTDRVGRRLEEMPAEPGRLMAYDQMDYPVGTPLNGRLDGGSGWTSPWRLQLASENPPDPRFQPRGTFRIVSAAESRFPHSNSAFQFNGPVGLVRPLKAPIALDQDAVYYLSYWTRTVPAERTSWPANPQLLSRVSLRVSEDWDGQAVAFWQNRSGRPRINTPTLGGFVGVVSKPVAEPSLWVVKIAARKSHFDQVFVRVFSPGETIPPSEPYDWTVSSQGFHSDSRFNVLFLNSVNLGTHWYSDIRLGTTWEAVTAHVNP
jgi:hypothetical protein